MQLTPQQIADFEKNGFLLLPSFASPKICEDILEIAKQELDEENQPIETEEEYLEINNSKKNTIRRLRQVYTRHEKFAQWMENREIRPILKQLLKDTPILTLAHHNSIMTKMPYTSSRTCWHQDIRYWNFENDNLLSVWLALDDEFLENGLLEFIPSSHKLNIKPHQFDKKTCFRDDIEENKRLISQKVHSNLKRGDVVLFHCKTLHAASKNYTNKPKISFVYTVRGESNLPIKDTRSTQHKEVTLL